MQRTRAVRPSFWLRDLSVRISVAFRLAVFGRVGGHSFLATSGPVMRVSSGNVAAMMAREMMIPPAVSR